MEANSQGHLKFKKILQNFVSLAGAKTLGDLSAFFLFVFLSRRFGQEGIGQYSLAIAFTGFFAVFSEFGLYHYSVKELSKDDTDQEAEFGRIFSTRMALAALSFATLLLILPFLPFSHETKIIFIIIGVYQILYRLVNGISTIFMAHEEMHFAGGMDLLLKVSTALLCIGTALLGTELETVLLVFPLVTYAFLVAAYGFASRRYWRPRLTFSLRESARTLRDAAPYASAAILFTVSSRTDVILLGFVLGTAAAGIYNVAYRLVFFLQFVAFYIGMALLPLVSRLYVADREQLRDIFQTSMNLGALIALPLAGGIWLVSPEIIAVFFGEEFVDSAGVLRILSLLVFLVFQTHLLGIFLIACDEQKRRSTGYWAAAAMNVTGNLILIPMLGVEGAGWAAVLSESVLVGTFIAKLRPKLGWPKVAGRLAIGTAAILAFCIPFGYLGKPNLAITTAASAMIYVAVLLSFKDIRNNELRFLRGLLSKRRTGATW